VLLCCYTSEGIRRYAILDIVDLRTYLGVYYFCRWLCLSLRLSVCLSAQTLLLFCFSMESSHFLAISSLWQKLQNIFFDYWFRPPNAQNLLSKICTKSPISRLVWQIDRRCLGLLEGFRGWPIQWNHAKCCGLTLIAMATKFGLGAEIQSPTGLYI